MDVKKIESLAKLMKETGLTGLELVEDGQQLRLERQVEVVAAPVAAAAPAAQAADTAAEAPAEGAESEPAETAEAAAPAAETAEAKAALGRHGACLLVQKGCVDLLQKTGGPVAPGLAENHPALAAGKVQFLAGAGDAHIAQTALLLQVVAH